MASLVSITFDDGLRCQFEQALDVLNQFDFRATFFLIANQEPTHERHANEWWKIEWSANDIARLRDMIRQRHEIGSHGVTHDAKQLAGNAYAETYESKRLIENWLGSPISSFCYPFYWSHSFLTEPAKQAGYKQARTGACNSSYPLSGPLPFNVDCRQISVNDDPRNWIKPNSWHVLTFHGIGDERSGWAPIPLTEFSRMMRELACYRDSGAVEVVTFEEAAKRFSRAV